MLSACRARGGLIEGGRGSGREVATEERVGGVGGGGGGGRLRGIRKQLEDSPSSFQSGTYNGISLGGGGGRCSRELWRCQLLCTSVLMCVCVRASVRVREYVFEKGMTTILVFRVVCDWLMEEIVAEQLLNFRGDPSSGGYHRVQAHSGSKGTHTSEWQIFSVRACLCVGLGSFSALLLKCLSSWWSDVHTTTKSLKRVCVCLRVCACFCTGTEPLCGGR